jgi:hypothetical protein
MTRIIDDVVDQYILFHKLQESSKNPRPAYLNEAWKPRAVVVPQVRAMYLVTTPFAPNTAALKLRKNQTMEPRTLVIHSYGCQHPRPLLWRHWKPTQEAQCPRQEYSCHRRDRDHRHCLRSLLRRLRLRTTRLLPRLLPPALSQCLPFRLHSAGMVVTQGLLPPLSQPLVPPEQVPLPPLPHAWSAAQLVQRPSTRGRQHHQ